MPPHTNNHTHLGHALGPLRGAQGALGRPLVDVEAVLAAGAGARALRAQVGAACLLARVQDGLILIEDGLPPLGIIVPHVSPEAVSA